MAFWAYNREFQAVMPHCIVQSLVLWVRGGGETVFFSAVWYSSCLLLGRLSWTWCHKLSHQQPLQWCWWQLHLQTHLEGDTAGWGSHRRTLWYEWSTVKTKNLFFLMQSWKELGAFCSKSGRKASNLSVAWFCSALCDWSSHIGLASRLPREAKTKLQQISTFQEGHVVYQGKE